MRVLFESWASLKSKGTSRSHKYAYRKTRHCVVSSEPLLCSTSKARRTIISYVRSKKLAIARCYRQDRSSLLSFCFRETSFTPFIFISYRSSYFIVANSFASGLSFMQIAVSLIRNDWTRLWKIVAQTFELCTVRNKLPLQFDSN